MERNKNLAREILAEIKDTDHFTDEMSFRPGALPGHWAIRKVSYHLVLLLEEDFLTLDTLHEGSWLGEGSRGGEGEARLRLTWKGHDLLEELQEEEPHF